MIVSEQVDKEVAELLNRIDTDYQQLKRRP